MESSHCFIIRDAVPYFVYRIHYPQRLELVDSFEVYRRAKQTVRELRNLAVDPQNPMIRIMFAPTPAEAERLLTEKREPRPLGEE